MNTRIYVRICLCQHLLPYITVVLFYQYIPTGPEFPELEIEFNLLCSFSINCSHILLNTYWLAISPEGSAEGVRIGKSQNQIVSDYSVLLKSESVRISKCQNLKVSELLNIRKCQKYLKPESARISEMAYSTVLIFKYTFRY